MGRRSKKATANNGAIEIKQETAVDFNEHFDEIDIGSNDNNDAQPSATAVEISTEEIYREKAAKDKPYHQKQQQEEEEDASHLKHATSEEQTLDHISADQTSEPPKADETPTTESTHEAERLVTAAEEEEKRKKNLEEEEEEARRQKEIAQEKKLRRLRLRKAVAEQLREWETERRNIFEASLKNYEEKFSRINDNIITSKVVLKDLLKFFKDRIAAEESLTQALMQQKPRAQDIMLKESNTTLKDGWSSFTNFTTAMGTLYSEQCQYTRDNVIAYLANLNNDFNSKSEQIISTKKKLTKALERAATNVASAYNSHRETLETALSLETNDQPVLQDPWLTEQEYHNAIAALDQQLAQYHDGMNKVFDAFTNLYEQRVYGVKKVLHDYASRQRLFYSKVQESLDLVAPAIDAINPIKDRQQWVQENFGTDNQPPLLPPQPSVSNISSESAVNVGGSINNNNNNGSNDGIANDATKATAAINRQPPISVPTLKEGYIFRQSSVMKSWKKNYFVLSPHGFLHCFDKQGVKEPSFSVILSNAVVAPGKKAPEFEIVAAPVKGQIMKLFKVNKKYQLRATTLEERPGITEEEVMSEWITALKQFTTTNDEDKNVANSL